MEVSNISKGKQILQDIELKINGISRRLKYITRKYGIENDESEDQFGFDELVAENQALRQENQELKQRLLSTKFGRDESQEKEDTMNDLASGIKTLRAEKEELTHKIAMLEEENADLEDQLNACVVDTIKDEIEVIRKSSQQISKEVSNSHISERDIELIATENRILRQKIEEADLQKVLNEIEICKLEIEQADADAQPSREYLELQEQNEKLIEKIKSLIEENPNLRSLIQTE